MARVRFFRNFAFVAFFAAQFARAGVNVNNGNFFIAYTDMFVSTPGIDLEVTRTYNSRSNYVKGYFGIGWSSELEGYLKADKGVVAYYEGGGGNEIKFSAAGKDTWTNSVFGQQSIKKLPKGWQMQSATGRVLFFGEQGQLEKITDRNKNFVEFVYNKGQLELIRDNHNNQMKLTWGSFGNAPRVVAIEKGNLKARYDYNAKGDLIKATGMDGVPYAFDYDDEHNMTKIAYKDGTYKEMGYNKLRDWVTKFRDRDTMVSEYSYFSDKLDPENKFGTTVSRWREGGESGKQKAWFWYEFRKRNDGTRYNYKSVSWIDQKVTETLYTECCGSPLAISEWSSSEPKSESNLAWTSPAGDKRVTQFEYYENGLLRKKTDFTGEITEIDYDKVHRKVASVAKAGRRLSYEYDQRGNLAAAFDSAENKRMDLAYDLKGRIQAVKERMKQTGGRETARQVFFRYDGNGRPVEIKETTATGSGTVLFKYGASGEVSGIFNANGQPIQTEREYATAQRVAATFQSLIEIVQPAGVSLTPEG